MNTVAIRRPWRQRRRGGELVQACDRVVAATDVRLADIHARFGQIPVGAARSGCPGSSGGRARLDHLVGPTGDAAAAAVTGQERPA